VSDWVHAITQLQDADSALNQANPTPFPLPVAGLEAVVGGAVLALSRSDWWVPGLRERVGAVLRDVPVERLVDGFRGARPYRVAPPTASPALRALYAVGLSVADRGRHVLVHLGVGSASDGAFYEALNLTVLLQPSVIYLVALHHLTDGTLGPHIAVTPAEMAKAFGIPAQVVDGASIVAVHDAVAQAKAAGGPHLIEARLTPGADLRARAAQR